VNQVIAALCVIILTFTGLTLSAERQVKKVSPSFVAVLTPPAEVSATVESDDEDVVLESTRIPSDDGPPASQPGAAVQYQVVDQPAVGDYSTRTRVRRFVLFPRLRSGRFVESTAGCPPQAYTIVQPPSVATAGPVPPAQPVIPASAAVASPSVTFQPYQFAPTTFSDCPNGQCAPVRRGFFGRR
jgi:hypothetical protein